MRRMRSPHKWAERKETDVPAMHDPEGEDRVSRTEQVNYLAQRVRDSHHHNEDFSVSELVIDMKLASEVADEVPCEVALDWRKHLFRFTPQE